MAQQVIVTMVDDIDGTEGAEEVRFGWDGIEWVIDLGPKNKETFEQVMADWTSRARRADRAPATPGGRPRRQRSRERSAEVRAWAVDQGLPVSERGRIPVSVQAKYEAAH